MGATYYRRKDRKRSSRKPWVVVVRWKGEREVSAVTSEQDAKALVQMIHKQESTSLRRSGKRARIARPPRPPSSRRRSRRFARRCQLGSSGRRAPARSAAARRPPTAHGSRRGCTSTGCRMGGFSATCRSTS